MAVTQPNRQVRPALPALAAALLARAAAVRGKARPRGSAASPGARRLPAWGRWAPGRKAIEDVAERLGYLGEDLLVHATAGSGQLSIEPVLVSVSEELRACALAFPRLEIHLDVDEHLMVVADRLRLHQVLGNLIRNAQRYGRPPVTIAAHATSQDWAEIVVSDAGDGIPPDFVAAMFDRHTRATGTGTTGTGIGLAVARELAERQRGSLDYRPDGNRFILTLPSGAAGDAD